MKSRIKQLKVKVLSLAIEARIIRIEEDRALDRLTGKEPGHRKIDYDLYRDLRVHRRGVVRTAARHALLAYAFLRGIDYSKIETRTDHEPNWAEVKKLVDRFGAVWEAGKETWPEFEARKTAQAARLDGWLVDAKGTSEQQAAK